MISGFITLSPSVRSLLGPPTQLLHHRYLHSAAFTFVYSDPNPAGRFTPTMRKSNTAQFPATPEQALPMQDLWAAPLLMEGEVLLFTSISSPHTQRRRMDPRSSNIHIYLRARLFQPIQALCTPEHGLPSWAKTSTTSTSLCQGALQFLRLCPSTVTRCFFPVWTWDETLLIGSSLSLSFQAPSLNRRPSGFWPRCLLDCLQLPCAVHLLSCRVSTK